MPPDTGRPEHHEHHEHSCRDEHDVRGERDGCDGYPERDEWRR